MGEHAPVHSRTIRNYFIYFAGICPKNSARLPIHGCRQLHDVGSVTLGVGVCAPEDTCKGRTPLAGLRLGKTVKRSGHLCALTLVMWLSWGPNGGLEGYRTCIGTR